MRHLIHLNALCCIVLTYISSSSHIPFDISMGYVTYHMVVRHGGCEDDVANWARHVTCMNEACLTYERVMSHVEMSHVTRMNELDRTYEWVMSHIWTSHVTSMNESCQTLRWVISHTNGWVMSHIVMSHIWTSHATRLNKSWHTLTWVMFEMSHVCDVGLSQYNIFEYAHCHINVTSTHSNVTESTSHYNTLTVNVLMLYCKYAHCYIFEYVTAMSRWLTPMSHQCHNTTTISHWLFPTLHSQCRIFQYAHCNISGYAHDSFQRDKQRHIDSFRRDRANVTRFSLWVCSLSHLWICSLSDLWKC